MGSERMDCYQLVRAATAAVVAQTANSAVAVVAQMANSAVAVVVVQMAGSIAASELKGSRRMEMKTCRLATGSVAGIRNCVLRMDWWVTGPGEKLYRLGC